jgi:hypothetical protein
LGFEPPLEDASSKRRSVQDARSANIGVQTFAAQHLAVSDSGCIHKHLAVGDSGCIQKHLGVGDSGCVQKHLAVGESVCIQIHLAVGDSGA